MSMINWQKDIDQLVDELPRLHKNLFFHQKPEYFHTSVNALKERIKSMESIDSYSVVMEIARIVAAFGDAHTAVDVPRYNRLPLACYWFTEGIFITETSMDYEDLCQHKIVSIGGVPMETVIACITDIVAHENKSFLKSQLPEYLICADILFGLGIVKDLSHIEMTVENHNKEQREVTIPTVKYEDWYVNEKVKTSEKMPLYRKNKEQYFWSEFDSARKLLYINYNKCKDMPHYTVEAFSEQLIQDINSNADIQKVVIDLRNNGGGNSELLKDYLKWLSHFARLNCQGNLFVIVGRDTFSSALLNTYYLKFNTQALFLGEPTGGKPNCYGEVQYLTLTSSGLRVRYSTKYYELIDDDDMLSFMPDVVLDVTFEDYRKKIDPCMEWIYEEFADSD